MLTENWVTMNWQIQVLTDQRCAKHEQQFHRTKEKNLILKQGGFCQFCEAPTKFHANKYLTQRLTSAESETYFCLKLQTFSTSNKVHKKILFMSVRCPSFSFRGLSCLGASSYLKPINSGNIERRQKIQYLVSFPQKCVLITILLRLI